MGLRKWHNKEKWVNCLIVPSLHLNCIVYVAWGRLSVFIKVRAWQGEGEMGKEKQAHIYWVSTVCLALSICWWLDLCSSLRCSCFYSVDEDARVRESRTWFWGMGFHNSVFPQQGCSRTNTLTPACHSYSRILLKCDCIARIFHRSFPHPFYGFEGGFLRLLKWCLQHLRPVLWLPFRPCISITWHILTYMLTICFFY